MAYFEFPNTRTYDNDLGWIIKKIGEIIINVQTQDSKIEAVEQLAAELKAFVNNYFDNLNVQQEINNKIDEMAADGTLTTILQTPISEQVAAWLAAHITPTTPAIDDTLTVAGAAADAKAAGDRIGLVEAEFQTVAEDLSNDVTQSPTYETQKRYDVQNGALVRLTGASYNTIHSAIIPVDAGDIIIYSGRVYNYPNQYSLIAIDASDNVYGYALNYTSDTNVNSYSFVVPVGATQLVVQSYMTDPVIKQREYLQRNDLALEYDNGIRSISRCGYNGPKNALYSFKNAYKEGFRILLGSLRFTSDNIPVLFHDTYINQNYRDVYNTDGSLVSTDPAVYIADITYAQFATYRYRRTIDGTPTYFPMCTLRDLILLCKRTGSELYIEIKPTLTDAQAQILTRMVQGYGITEKTSWCADAAANLAGIISRIPDARVATTPATIATANIDALNALDNGKIKKFFFGYASTPLTGPIVDTLIANNIAYEMGQIDTEEELRNYYNQAYAYQYCTGVESNLIVPGRVLLHDSII